MTATRIAGRWWRVATLIAFAAVWLVAAWLLWRSRVPDGLDLPRLDPRDYFSQPELVKTERYERFLEIDYALSLLALLAALAYFAKKGPDFIRESAAGRIGTGMLLGMLAFAVVWVAQLPFGVASLWWQRRHHVSRQGYFSWIVENWLGLGGQFLFICLAILIVMGLASVLGRRWWLAGAPAFVGLAVLFAFVLPYLVVEGTNKLRQPGIAADARRLAEAEGVADTDVLVEKVHDETRAANAYAAGIGPSRRVVLWDTFLDGRFTRGEIRVVLAHEFAHLARSHIWKGLAWYALFAVPGAYLVTRAVRRRAGLTEPAAIPLALLVLTALQILGLPLENVISRRMEAEADWIALQETRDPASARALFEKFARTSLAQPRPPTWDYLLFENHPTLIQRIAMAEAWAARARRPAATRAGS